MCQKKKLKSRNFGDVLSERRKDGYFLSYVCSRKNLIMFLNNSDKEFVLLNKYKGKVNYSPNL